MSLKNLIQFFEPYNGKIPKRPEPVKRLSLRAYQDHHGKRKALAENLAHKIYSLVNIDRVIDPNAYIKLINDAVLHQKSEDNQFILKYMQEFFVSHYLENIKKLGESPNMLDQIVKRTGRESRKKFEKILYGFNVVEIAEKIFRADFEHDPEKATNLYEIVKDLEKNHLEELVAEFYVFPARDIAKFINQCLEADIPDLATLKLLLQTNPPNEIKLILEQFEELFILQEGTDNLSFFEWLNNNYDGQTVAVLKQILNGLDYNLLAKHVNWVLNNIDNLWTEFAGLQSSVWKLIMHIQKNSKDLSWQKKELLARPFILGVIYHLDKNQFRELNKYIQEQYQFQLTEEFYDLDWHDTAIQTFFKLEKSINLLIQHDKSVPFVVLYHYTSCIADLNEEIHIVPESEEYMQVFASLFPLYSLVKKQIYELKENVKILAFVSLEELIKTAIQKFSTNNISQNVNNLIELLDSCLQHEAAYSNIYHFLEQQQEIVTGHKVSKELEKAANKLDVICSDLNLQATERGRTILSELQLLNKRDLSYLIIYYYNEYSKNIFARLKPLITPAAFLKVKILLSGFNSINRLHRIQKEKTFNELFFYSPIEIAVIDSELRSTSGSGLIEYIIAHSNNPDLDLIPAFFPLASQFKKNILDDISWGQAETENFLERFNVTDTHSFAFESAFNFLFSCWESGLEHCQGPWRNSLQVEVIRGGFKKEHCVSIISRLENLPIELIPEIYGIAKESELGNQAAKLLNVVLRKYKQHLKVIKMLYLIYDAEKSLRERIYKFKILPRDEHLTLLLLDGYDPEELARGFAKLIRNNSGENLSFHPQAIPQKANWRGEMYHQIRIRYEEQNQRSLITDLKQKQVPDEGEGGIKEIAELLYGDMCKKGFALRKLFETKDSEKIEETLLKVISNYKAAQIERMAHFYESYYEESLEDAFKKLIKTPDVFEKMKQLLAGARNWEQAKLEEKIKFANG